MMPESRLGATGTAALLAALLLLSALPLTAQAQPQAKLVIITPHWEGIRKEYDAAFKAWYKQKHGVDVEIVWESMGTSDCVRAIEDWYSKHKEGRWDIMWGGGVDPFLKLKSEGLLEAFPPSEDSEFAQILSQIPKEFNGIPVYDYKDYMWFGTALSGFGIIYNKPLLKKLGLPEPKTWADLTDYKMQGWVGSADPRHSGSTHMAYEIILQAYGWEKGWAIITEMGGNIRDFPEHSSAIPKAVASGQLAYGLAIDFYAWAQIAKVGSENIGYVMPEGLTVINPDSIAILKNAPHRDVAREFVKFVLSKEGQKLWMLPAGKYPDGPKKYTLGRMSVIPSLYDELKDRSIVPVNPFEIKSVLRYDAGKGGKRWSLVNDLFGALIIDTHDDLVAAWKKLNENKDKMSPQDYQKILAELTKIPLTEDEALQYASKWSDQAFRNQKISEWRNFAVQKYRKVSEMVDQAVAKAQGQPSQPGTAPNTALYLGAAVAVIAVAAAAWYLAKKRK